MDRRKDTNIKGVKLPSEYTEMIEDVFNKNFKTHLDKSEKFIVFGDMYPDEIVISVSLKNKKNERMITCYASTDFNSTQKNVNQAVQTCVGQCVDGVAGFYTTFFEEGRPVDYEVEYRQGWTMIPLDAKTKIHMKINRDNPELESQADALLDADSQMLKKETKAKKSGKATESATVKKKKTLH